MPGWTILGKQSEWPVVSFARGRTGFIRLPDRDIEEHDRLVAADKAHRKARAEQQVSS